VRTRDGEAAMLWDKFALLAPFALLTTHARGAAGDIRTARIGDLVPMLRETAAVAGADGVNVDPDGVLAFIESMPSSMESSMQRDQAAGRPMELDALGGALLRRARRHGVDVPVVRRIVADLEERSGQRISA
jgi:2-dehydropantoate 2-reductase